MEQVFVYNLRPEIRVSRASQFRRTVSELLAPEALPCARPLGPLPIVCVCVGLSQESRYSLIGKNSCVVNLRSGSE